MVNDFDGQPELSLKLSTFCRRSQRGPPFQQVVKLRSTAPSHARDGYHDRIFDLLTNECFLKTSCEIFFESCLRHQNGRRTRNRSRLKGFLAAATVLVHRKEAVESIDQTNGPWFDTRQLKRDYGMVFRPFFRLVSIRMGI
jgi:hypothetical protein